MESTADNAAKFKTWIAARGLLVQHRNALREQLHVYVLPIVKRWVSERSDIDPVSEQAVFELENLDTPAADRPSSNRWIKRLSIKSPLGDPLVFEVPDHAAIVQVSGSGEYDRDYVTITPSTEAPQNRLHSF